MATTTHAPVRKVTAGALSGAIVTLVIWMLNTYVPMFNRRPIPAEITGTLTTIVSFMISYAVPPGRDETVIEDEQGRTLSATAE
jgi:hypothetical protein